MLRYFRLGLLVALVGIVPAMHAEEANGNKEASKKITYDEHVQPIFREKCFSCHNPDKKSGGLDLTSYGTLMQGGSSGDVIDPGSADGSYLYLLVSHQSEPYMPPMSDRIADGPLNIIKAWIEGGALENSGSKPVVSKKPKVNLALSESPTERPSVIPMPGHLDKEPVVVTPVPGTITAMATSPWAPVVAISGQKQVLLYNTQTLEFVGALPFPEGIPYVLRFSRNGSLLLAGGGRGGASGRVVVWNIATGERVFEVGDELDAVLAADISADQTMIALGGPQKVVRVYATSDGRLLYEARKHTDWILSVEFSPDGVLLASGDRSGNLLVWEAVTGREYLTLKGHTAAITGISWRADSNVVASCSEDASIRLWEMENGNQIKSWGAHGSGAASVEFARDARLVSTGRDRVTKLWAPDGNQQRAFDAFEDIGVVASFCDETNRVIAGDWKGVVRVWDAGDGKLVGTLAANPPTLATRLETAKQHLAARQAEWTPLAAAADEAAKALEKVKADLSANQTATAQANEAKTKQAQLAEQAAATAKTLDEQIKALTDRKTTLAAQAPKLKQIADLAKEVSAAAAGDEALAQLSANANNLAQQRAEQLAAVEKELTGKQADLEATRKNLAAYQAEITKLDQQLQTLKTQFDALTAALKPAEEKAAATRAAADTAAQAVEQAKREVDRWQAELDFVAQMRELEQQQAAAEQAAAQQAARVGELTQNVADLQKRVDDSLAALEPVKVESAKASNELETAQKAAAAAESEKKQADANVESAARQLTTLQTATTALQEAAAKAQEAAQKTGDKDLQAAAESLSALVAKKQAELQTAQKTHEATVAAAAEAAKKVEAAQQTLATAKAAAEATAAKLATAEQQHQQLVQQVTAARQDLKQAEAQLAELQKKAEQVAARILAARQPAKAG